MKKYVIFSFIGAVILFIWLFMSFAMPNFHKKAMEYTPKQDSILEALAQSGLQEGMYVLGQPDPAIVMDEAKCAEEMKKYEGKPWAVVNYQMNNSSAMGMNMFRGFSICFLISWILFWMISHLRETDLKTRLLLSLGVGFISFLFVPYTGFIWFKAPDIMAYLVDGIVPWLLLGWIGHRMAGNA